jgi:hypothetical protein
MFQGNMLRGGAGRENPNLTSGSKAKQKEVKCINLEVVYPIDYETALSQLKNNKSLFFMILCRFRNQNLLPLVN